MSSVFLLHFFSQLNLPFLSSFLLLGSPSVWYSSLLWLRFVPVRTKPHENGNHYRHFMAKTLSRGDGEVFTNILIFNDYKNIPAKFSQRALLHKCSSFGDNLAKRIKIW